MNESEKIGHWMADEYGLPCFNYTGKLPFEAKLKDGGKVKLPEDPWFLLGNYRLTLFTHISGNYQLITGQRAWGRLNQGDLPNTGSNCADIILRNDSGNEKTYQLTGMNSLAADPDKCTRIFGCGFADYLYKTDELICKRTISVKPSTNPYNGVSVFLVTMKFTNKSDNKIKLTYNESVMANYEATQQQRKPADKKKVRYSNAVSINKQLRIIKADIRGITDDPLQFPDRNEMSQLDGFPPSLFIKAVSAKDKPRFTNEKKDKANNLKVRFEFTLKPDEEKIIEVIIGYCFENGFSAIEKMCKMMMKKNPGDWLKVLPKFEDETDAALKREMIWHAYNLEAMATYSEYYKQTKIPQGTIYDYDWGVQCSARDHLQHGLPLCYYNPELAKSILKYIMKRTTPWGEIRLIEFGNGFSHAFCYFTSDQQLFYFMLLAEFLRITKDYDFLLERVEFYPVKNMPKENSLDFIECCFKFLRDEIGTGSHGLVRLMNSDWNDMVFYVVKEPYNKVLYTGESHMNSAMAIKIIGDLIDILKLLIKKTIFSTCRQKISLLIESMTQYRNGILDAFIKDLGERSFSKRMYFAGKSYGDENMFLEPQGYMMQMKEISVEKKKVLYEEMKKRLYAGEKIGARQQQMPEFQDDDFDWGSRENGGFWYALNGPVIIGVAQFDKAEAMKLLKKMSFDNYAKSFPDYWSSYWSASDNIESSLIPVEGLPDQTTTLSDIPVYCAHPHAWLLYCYYYLKNSGEVK